jgi:hypothetical protein
MPMRPGASINDKMAVQNPVLTYILCSGIDLSWGLTQFCVEKNIRTLSNYKIPHMHIDRKNTCICKNDRLPDIAASRSWKNYKKISTLSIKK